jgi:hypothetical protein
MRVAYQLLRSSCETLSADARQTIDRAVQVLLALVPAHFEHGPFFSKSMARSFNERTLMTRNTNRLRAPAGQCERGFVCTLRAGARAT